MVTTIFAALSAALFPHAFNVLVFWWPGSFITANLVGFCALLLVFPNVTHVSLSVRSQLRSLVSAIVVRLCVLLRKHMSNLCRCLIFFLHLALVLLLVPVFLLFALTLVGVLFLRRLCGIRCLSIVPPHRMLCSLCLLCNMSRHRIG